jgi:hypothetical protein
MHSLDPPGRKPHTGGIAADYALLRHRKAASPLTDVLGSYFEPAGRLRPDQEPRRFLRWATPLPSHKEIVLLFVGAVVKTETRQRNEQTLDAN